MTVNGAVDHYMCDEGMMTHGRKKSKHRNCESCDCHSRTTCGRATNEPSETSHAELFVIARRTAQSGT